MVSVERVDCRSGSVERAPSGIIVVRFREGVALDLAGVNEIIAERVRMAAGRRSAVMVVMAADTQTEISVNITDHGDRVADTTLAEALVAPSAVVQQLGDLYYTFFQHSFPVAIFATEAEAAAWLEAQM